MPRVAAIGIDAAEWRLVERMLDEGQLPNLARIRRRGAECRLSNQAIYRNTLVWDAFLTGREDANDPRAGGVELDPATYRVRKIGAASTPPFYARSPPIETIAFDVPHLSLAGAGKDDVRVCTWGAHSLSHARASHPDGLLREIDAKFGRHPAFGEEHRYAWHRPQYVDWLAQALVVGSQRRVDIAEWLQARFPTWRLFLTVMSECHSAGENLGYVLDESHPLSGLAMAADHRERLHDVYRALDRAIGRIADGLPSDTVLVVFSLHGTTANDSELPSTVLLPELLHRLSFGRPLLRDPDQQAWRRERFVIVPPAAELWNDYMRKRFGSGIVGALRQRIRRLLPPRLLDVGRSMARRLAGAPFHLSSRLEEEGSGSSLDWQVPTWYRSRWPRMKVFALPSFGDARLRVNVRGREGDGIVEPADYDRVCSEIEDAIRACRDPRTGRPVVKQTWRPRAADPMRQGGHNADIVIQWSHAVDALEHPEVGLIGPFPFRSTGGHTGGGFAFFSGPGIARADLGEWRAIDLPATIVALLGHEPPSDLDGRPIPGLCEAGLGSFR